MHSLSGGAGGASVNGEAARDKTWTEYVDTLRDSLTESKVIDMVVGTTICIETNIFSCHPHKESTTYV